METGNSASSPQDGAVTEVFIKKEKESNEGNDLEIKEEALDYSLEMNEDYVKVEVEVVIKEEDVPNSNEGLPPMHMEGKETRLGCPSEARDRVFPRESFNYECGESLERENVNSRKTDGNETLDMFTNQKEKTHTCDTCNKAFVYRSRLLTHMRTHTGEKPYVCEICSKSFSLNTSLQKHLRTHTGEKPYICETCGQGFSQNSSLVKHIRKHSGEKPYACEICGRAFSRNSILLTHMRTHTGEKPYVCETCNKAFSINSTLKAHMRLHTGEKPYVCEICSKAFSHNSSLQLHMRTHTGE